MFMRKEGQNWELQGGKEMYPLIEGLNRDETKRSLELAGADNQEIEKLLELGEKAKDAIIQVTMRQWEDDPEWASIIMHKALVELGIRPEEEK